jgi:hypothetical protein
VILFFYYNKRVLAMVLLCCLLFGALALGSNLAGGQFPYDCVARPAGALPFLCAVKARVSLANKQPQWLLPQLVLGAVMCLVWALAIRVMRHLGRRKNREIDD